MPDTNTGASQTQGASGAQAQGATTAAQGATGSTEAGTTGDGSGSADVTVLLAKVAELERDNRSYREKDRQREESQRQADEAKLSEAERQAKRFADMETENAALKAQLRDERIRARIQSAAARQGFADPGDAFRLLDQDRIEFDANGGPTNVDKLLEGLAKTKPYLLSSNVRATGSAEGGVRGTGAAAGADMNTLIRQAAGRS